MDTPTTLTLQVYVEQGCTTCERAIRLAREVEADYPGLTVQVIDIATTDGQRDDVFAVPTFVLGGRVLSLGTPRPSTLRRSIEALLRDGAAP